MLPPTAEGRAGEGEAPEDQAVGRGLGDGRVLQLDRVTRVDEREERRFEGHALVGLAREIQLASQVMLCMHLPYR